MGAASKTMGIFLYIPADVYFANPTMHMVATVRLLKCRGTFGATLPMLFQPSLERGNAGISMVFLPVHAGNAWVRRNVASGANLRKATRAGKKCAIFSWPVDTRAVWRWAVLEFLWILSDVLSE